MEIEAEYFSDHTLFNNLYDRDIIAGNILLTSLNEKNDKTGFIIKYIVEKYGFNIIPDNIMNNDFFIVMFND